MPAHFILRRLHALAGVLSFGLLLFPHYGLLSRALAPQGISVYNNAAMAPEFPFSGLLFLVFVATPLLFHFIYGFVLLYESEPQLTRYTYGPHVRYWLQRIAFIFVLGFLILHATVFVRIGGPQNPDYLTIAQFFQVPWHAWAYGIGGIAAFYYFFNGLWEFGVSWGLLTGASAQKIAVRACMALFFFFCALHLLLVLNFTYHYDAPPAVVAGFIEWVKGSLY